MTIIHSSVQADFKNVMAGVATPVSIVTTLVEDRPYGTTVSAFASLSMNPPMVLVSLDRDSQTLEFVRESGRFGLNILSSQQTRTALAFAKKGGVGKFQGTPWELDADLPRILTAPGWVACTVERLVDGGDHVIVLGNVTAADTSDGTPLIYHGRLFGTYLPHDRNS
jgi:flavin reductase (DIM6/NTAB) family NADH-FMN oxidoreductase RutF